MPREPEDMPNTLSRWHEVYRIIEGPDTAIGREASQRINPVSAQLGSQ